MTVDEFAYVAETNKNFDDAVVSLLKAIEQAGWSIFAIYDVRERLRSKGFDQRPLKIIEACSGKYANRMLNSNRLTSICMPCRINVLEDEGKIKIISVRPTLLATFLDGVKRDEAEEVERDIIAMIDAAK